MVEKNKLFYTASAYLLISYFIFIPLSSYAEDGLIPEDGTGLVRSWYYSASNDHVTPQVLRVIRSEGIEPREIGFEYAYIQDVALFTKRGSLVLQADIPPLEKVLGWDGLSMGIFSPDDPCRAGLTRLLPQDAIKKRLPYRQMKWTFLEGGGLITGIFADEKPYAILRHSDLERVENYYRYRMNREITRLKAKEFIAEDLGIPVQNLFFIEASGHLDLFILALPNGVLLVNDPRLAATALKKVLQLTNQKERERLEGLNLYYEAVSDMVSFEKSLERKAGGKRVVLASAYSAEKVQEMEIAVRELSKRFTVVRVAGEFNQPLQRSDGGFWLSEEINFFNGFSGVNSRGERFHITNRAPNLPSLEKYWRNILQRFGFKPSHVHFEGFYQTGTGIDCAGAISG